MLAHNLYDYSLRYFKVIFLTLLVLVSIVRNHGSLKHYTMHYNLLFPDPLCGEQGARRRGPLHHSKQ